jgi:hypothetical protein
MFLLSVLVAAALAWWGLRSRVALVLQWLLAVLALGLASERLWQLTRLPPPAQQQPDFHIEGGVKPLVVTRTDLVAHGQGVVLRARLPSLTERVVLPTGRPMTVMVSVASLGQNVAWTFHNGPEDWGWAMLGPMGWVVPPQHLFDSVADSVSDSGAGTDPRRGVYVVEDRGELLLATVSFRQGGYALEVQQIAIDGALSPPETVALDDGQRTPHAVCRVEGRWQVEDCPNALLARLLQDELPGEWAAADAWVRVSGGGAKVRASWLSDGLRLEEAGDATFLQRHWVDGPEARAQGLLPQTHTRVVRVDAKLREISPSGWAQGADPLAFLLDTGVEVVLVGSDGSAQARFDRRTFARLDPLPPLDAIWAQLEQTGGAQPLLSVLGVSLSGLLLVPLGARAMLRGAVPLPLSLASGGWVLLTLPAAVALMSRWS